MYLQISNAIYCINDLHKIWYNIKIYNKNLIYGMDGSDSENLP